jgi:hypothetical protein
MAEGITGQDDLVVVFQTVQQFGLYGPPVLRASRVNELGHPAAHIFWRD